MDDNNQGRVIPFVFRPGRTRRSAERLKRIGRPVDAVERLRQTAERQDTPRDWLALAGALAGIACYEQASVILFRLVAGDEPEPEVWMLLARCQHALGRRETAVDSLYHYLAADPFSDTADTARALLAQWEGTAPDHEARRLNHLVRRGLLAWKSGKQETGKNRLRRAARLAADPARIRITLALLLLAVKDVEGAEKELRLTLRRTPDHPRALSALCVALNGLGREEEAREVLARCEAVCTGPENEEMFLTAAWTMEDVAARRRYLEEALRRTPCRIALLQPLARCLYAAGERAQAIKTWERILRIDPGDQETRICLEWIGEHPEEPLPEDGGLPAPPVQARMLRLLSAMRSPTPRHELLAPGSQTRMLTDWCLTMQAPDLQQTLLELLAVERHPAVTAYLRQALTSPTVMPQVREAIFRRVSEMEDRTDLMMMVGPVLTDRYVPEQEDSRRPSAAYLSMVLEETRRLGQSMPMLEYAADEWRTMTRRQHRLAARDDSYAWVKAIELLYLRETGQEETAMRVLERSQVTVRRLERVMRSLARHHELLKGEE